MPEDECNLSKGKVKTAEKKADAAKEKVRAVKSEVESSVEQAKAGQDIDVKLDEHDEKQAGM